MRVYARKITERLNFGDEAIQRTSRMICEIYKHSPVFRIGGDEFAVILTGSDFDDRETLIKKLKEESLANQRSRSGPVVACGMAVYDTDTDNEFSDVFERADNLMYENKNDLKTGYAVDGFKNMVKIENRNICTMPIVSGLSIYILMT